MNKTENQASGRRGSTEERKVAIAMAARALIVEKGFERLRTRDIAARVGINIATLHYHVPTKNDLITLVAQSIRAEFQQQSKRRPRAHLPPLEQLRLELDDQRETLFETPELVVLMSELAQLARHDPAIAAIMEPMRNYWDAQLVEIVKAGRATGAFRCDLDPIAAARIITGTVSAQWQRADASPALFNTICQELERALLNPVFAKKDAAR